MNRFSNIFVGNFGKVKYFVFNISQVGQFVFKYFGAKFLKG